MRNFLKSILLLFCMPYGLWATSCPSYFTVRDIAKALIEDEFIGGEESYSYKNKQENKPYLSYSYKENYKEGNFYLIQNEYNYTITSLEEIDDDKFKVEYKVDAFSNSTYIEAKLSIIFKLNTSIQNKSDGCVEYIEKMKNQAWTEDYSDYRASQAG